MHKLTIVSVALLLASTAAHAGNSISFEIEGQRVRIEAPRNCDELSCITITAPGLSKAPIRLKDLNFNGLGGGNDDEVVSNSVTPAQPTPSAPTVQSPTTAQTPPVPSQQVQRQQVQGQQVQAPQVAPQIQAAPTANNLPSTGPGLANAASAPAATSLPPLPEQANAAPQTTPAVAPAAATTPTTPIGLWATEENKGNVRIEPCGANLCGYAEKTGERILINMQPNESKWVGRIHDPDSGRNYDSTIALKGSNLLRVQGCAFGGMFCGGQTWKRVS